MERDPFNAADKSGVENKEKLLRVHKQLDNIPSARHGVPPLMGQENTRKRRGR